MLAAPTQAPPGEQAGPARAARREPRWLRALALATAAAVVAFGAVGQALAVAGVYRPYIAFPLGAVAWVLLLLLARPVLRAPGATSARSHLVSAAGVAFSGGVALWHAQHASQHVLINRDPGAYLNAGRWIAAHGNLRVPAPAGAFAHQPALTFGSFGVYQNHDGSLSFQFAHLLPALLAQARALGGDRLMFVAPSLLAGVVLLALFVAAWRLLRFPLVALGAVVAFAFLVPEVSFSRDAFSEIPTQIFLFTALWLVVDRRALRTPRIAFLVGLVLGALQAARIDALAELLGVPLLFAITWVLADARERRPVAVSAGACAAGIVPGVVLGFTDVALRSHQYLHDLRGDVRQLGEAMVASVVVAAVVVLVAPRAARLLRRAPRRLGEAVAGLVVVGGLGAWLVRPRVQTAHGKANLLVQGLQVAAHVKVDATRTYAEHSMVWMSWYLGPVALAAAIAAAAVLACALVRGRLLRALGPLVLLVPASALYLWRPNAAADQVWVMRRYLFSALPLFVLLAFGLVAFLAGWVPARVPRVVPAAGAVLIGVAAVAYPIAVLRPVAAMTDQRTFAGVVDDACRIVGPRAAVVVLVQSDSDAYNAVPQTLRGFCDVQVATLDTGRPGRAALLRRIAAAARASGEQLWVAAGTADTIRAVLPEAVTTATPTAVNPRLLERTVVRRPRHYVSDQFAVVLARVPPA